MDKIKKDKRTMHEKEVDRLYEQMSKIEDQGSEEYQRCLESLGKLTDVDCAKKQVASNKDRIEILKPLIGGAFGMLQVLAILNKEELAVVSSKALGFVLRGRV